MPAQPPATRRDDTVDDHFGVPVADPYRWLEDVDSAETRAWVRGQAAFAEDWLAAIPARAEINTELTAIWDREVVGTPTRHGGVWLQWRNSGLQAQPVLYSGDTEQVIERVLLDPNALSVEGTTAVTQTDVTHDGSLLAYATSEAGSDWQLWRVRDIATGVDRTLPDGGTDTVERAKFSGAAWLGNSGFCYTVPSAFTPGVDLVEGQAPMQLKFHELGTPSSADTLVLDAPGNPDWFFGPAVTEDQRWLTVSISQGTEQGNRLVVRRLEDQGAAFTVVVPETDVVAQPVAGDDDALYLHTDHLAPRGRVVRVSLADPGREHWQEVIAEDSATLLSVSEFAGGFIVHRLRDAAAELIWHRRSGELVATLAVPPAVSVLAVSTSLDSHVVMWETVSFTDPGSIWRQDLAGETEPTLLRRTALKVALDDLVSERVFVTSADGARVPVFLTRRRDVTPTGDVPTLLYGYGGFNIPITPSFSPAWATWVRRGGLLAVACLRGGGEYGRDWYDAGRLAHKTKVYDDACSVASWLDTSGWSRPERIGINGRSNGGLLVGACLTRHPELFGAFVPEVGVLDLLRFHLFTVGWAWKSDYGDPEVEADFRALIEWSPLHRLVPGQPLPPVLITTGDHDDRVVPGHSFKFAATLQAALPPGSGPGLLRVDLDAGHGAGKPTAKLIAEKADVLAFLEATLTA